MRILWLLKVYLVQRLLMHCLKEQSALICTGSAQMGCPCENEARTRADQCPLVKPHIQWCGGLQSIMILHCPITNS